MNKTGVIAIAIGLAIAGSVGFYFWNEKVRPEQEEQKRQVDALAKACKVHEAARTGDLALLEKMFEAGCSLNGRDDFGMTPLHVVANDRAAAFLLSKGAYVDAKDGRGYTPLQVMEMAGRQDVVDLLKRRGAKK